MQLDAAIELGGIKLGEEWKYTVARVETRPFVTQHGDRTQAILILDSGVELETLKKRIVDWAVLVKAGNINLPAVVSFHPARGPGGQETMTIRTYPITP